MTTVSIDFETRSTVDLRKTGVYPYAQHGHTGIWCMAWALDDEEKVRLWTPDQPFPEELTELIEEGCELRAWNAQFERVMWTHKMRQYGAPMPTLEQWVDTAAEAGAMALPRSLDECARVTGIVQQKDTSGYQLMLRMARPRSMMGTEPVWWDRDTSKKERLFAYCMQDVRVERNLAKILRPLSPEEREVYLLDQRINDRGVGLDAELVTAALEIVDEGLERANLTLNELTKGEVSGVSKVNDLRIWVNKRVEAEVVSLNKASTRDLLESDLSADVREALELRAEAGRTSTAKLKAMLEAVCDDNRIRGMLMYHGANTGRWSGRLVQPQNLPRGDIDDAESMIPLILERQYDRIDLHHPPIVVVSSLLRRMFRAGPGHVLLGADYSQIEARVLAWLAGQQDLVELFASGGKVYEHMAGRIYNVPTEEIKKGSDERQLGKATVLGCGFGMGGPKFKDTAKVQYGLDLTDEFAKHVVDTYRAANPKVVDWWWKLNDAALHAVHKPGEIVTAGACRFTSRGGYLILKLPSGRLLHYARPKIVDRPTPWGDVKASVVVEAVNSFTRRWSERNLYGGLLAENVVQATARDIMAAAMLRLDRHGYPVILTVHDEIVTEPLAAKARPEDFLRLMTELPTWAAGCPVAAETWIGERYQK